MQADSFSWEESAKGKEAGLTEILDTLIDDAYERGVLEENSVVYRDLFDTKLMGSLTPRPVQVMKKFQQLQEESSRGQRTGIISQSGHELYPKGQSCERYPLEDRDRIW